MRTTVDVANCLQFHRVTRLRHRLLPSFLPSSTPSSIFLLSWTVSKSFTVPPPPAFPAFPRDSIFIIFQDSTPLLFPPISLASIVPRVVPNFPETWKDLDLYPPRNFPDEFLRSNELTYAYRGIDSETSD